MPLETTIAYDNSSNFVFDSGKVEFPGSTAQLTLESVAESLNEDFADNTDFTYTPADAEFNAGQLEQVSQLPPNATFGATYDSSIDGNWGDGVLTGTGVGSPTIVGNKLDLKGFGKYVDYSAVGNADSAQVGAIKFKFTPNYSTKPSTWVTFFTICNASGALGNRIEFRQSSSAGQLQFRLNNSAGSSLGTKTLANWTPTAGQTYEFEFNWDYDSGNHRVFIDGVLFASYTQTGTRSTAATLLRVGADYNLVNTMDGEFEDFVVFETVQHTANYTPGYTLESGNYTDTDAELPPMTPTGVNFTGLTGFSASEAGSPRWTASVDGGAELYWNGSAWVASSSTYATASSAADMNTNIGTLTGVVGSTSLVFKVYFVAGATQGVVSDLVVTGTSERYPLDDPTVEVAGGQLMDCLDTFAAEVTETGADAVRFHLSVSGQAKYWDGVAWENSNGTYAESNTAEEINTNAGSLDLSSGATVKVVAVLHSDDGTTTPSVSSVTMSYCFFATATALPNECIVYTRLIDNEGEPIVGAPVTISNDTFFHGEYLVHQRSVSKNTDASGYVEFSLIETQTVARKMTLSTAITDGSTIRRFTKTFTVPNQETAALNTLS